MTSSEFVEELRLQFERYVDVKERLDAKANNMITMAGTVATLFMGFGIFLLEHVDHATHPNIVLIASILLLAEVLLTAVTILLAFLSYRLRTYVHPISYEAFYNTNGKLDDQITMQFKDATSDDIKDHFVNEYLKSIKSYEEQNDSQTGLIDIGRVTFMISVFIIPAFSYFILLSKF